MLYFYSAGTNNSHSSKLGGKYYDYYNHFSTSTSTKSPFGAVFGIPRLAFGKATVGFAKARLGFQKATLAFWIPLFAFSPIHALHRGRLARLAGKL